MTTTLCILFGIALVFSTIGYMAGVIDTDRDERHQQQRLLNIIARLNSVNDDLTRAFDMEKRAYEALAGELDIVVDDNNRLRDRLERRDIQGPRLAAYSEN